MDLKELISEIQKSDKSSKEIVKLIEEAFKDAEKAESKPKDIETKESPEVKVKPKKHLNLGLEGSSNLLKGVLIGTVILGLASTITFPVLAGTVWKNNSGSTPYVEFSLTETSINLTEGVPHKLVARGVPAGSTLKWFSNKPDIVNVDENGNVYAEEYSDETVTIYATAGDKFVSCEVNGVALSVHDFATCSWADIDKKCKRLENGHYTNDLFAKSFTYNSEPIQSIDDLVGKERPVYITNPDGTVQENPHMVRVIGYNHDMLADDDTKKAALTFEFSYLICDNNGISIGLPWNDVDSNTTNCTYINSSMRKALNGTGNFPGPNILYSQRGQTSWAGDYTNKTILGMLPDDLQNSIRTIKKMVPHMQQFTPTACEDKLFLPTCIEMGYDTGQSIDIGTTYAYYVGCTAQANAKRIKKQVNPEHYLGSSQGIPSTSGQYSEKTVYNSAGRYNNYQGVDNGGEYWINTANSSSFDNIYVSLSGGTFISTKHAAGNAFAIAPIFCI